MSRLKSSRLAFEDNGRSVVMWDPPAIVVRLAVSGLPRGTLFLSDGNRWLSELVGIWTIITRPVLLWRLGFRNRYSHCGAVFGPKGATIEALPKGVVEGDLADRIVSGSRVSAWTCDRITPELADTLHGFMTGMVGKNYDWLKAISFVVPVGEDGNAYTCSEAVGTAYGLIGALPHDLADGTPNDMADFLNRHGASWGWRKTLSWS